MTLPISVKQNCIYLTLVISISIASIFLYRTTQQDWIIYREAETKFANKDYKSAINLYNKSLAAGLPSSKLSVNLANSYFATGNFKEAIIIYKNHLLSHPKDTRVRLELARALSYIGNYAESEVEYKKALEDANENLQSN